MLTQIPALVLTAGLAVPPPTVTGKAPSEDPAPVTPTAPTADDDRTTALAHAAEIYERATARYDLVDYRGAIELWMESYRSIPDGPSSEVRRLSIMYNIGRTYLDLYEVERDPSDLRRARTILQRFLEDSLALGTTDNPELSSDVANATALVEKVAASLTDHERELERERQATERVRVSALDFQPSPGALALQWTGATGLALGTGGLATMLVALAQGAHHEDRAGIPELSEGRRVAQIEAGKRANRIAIAGGVVAGVLVPTGIVLLAVGLRRARSEREAARTPMVRLGPVEIGAREVRF